MRGLTLGVPSNTAVELRPSGTPRGTRQRRWRAVRSNGMLERGNPEVPPLAVNGVSINVALDGLSDDRRMAQRRHVFCAWNDLISTLRNMVPKNLCKSSVRNGRLFAAHHERRQR